MSSDFKVAPQFSNFEDISLAHECDDDSFRYSNISTPTLASDASSLRSSLGSFSSPILSNGPFSARPNEAPLYRKLSMPDNTSMASLSRIPVSQRRSHKQREVEFAQDNDDFWPTDALMFNVPMSPALCAQEKRPSVSHANSKTLPSIKEKDHEILDKDTRDIQAMYANVKSKPSLVSLNSTSTNKSSLKKSSSQSSKESITAKENSGNKTKSLTRPEHLPPKSIDEERRHMSEFNRLVAHAKAQEKVREEQARTKERRRSQQRDNDADTWKTALQKGSKIDRALWWRGVPEKYRSVVWPKALKIQTIPIKQGSTDTTLISLTNAVFPECGLFGVGRPLHNSLLTVVESVACLRSISATQCSPLLYPAAVLLLALDESAAAACLAQLVPADGLVYAVLSGNESIAQAHYTSYYKVFRAKFPQLYSHFTGIRLAPHQYLDFFIGPLMMNILSIDSASRLIDLIVSEGESFLLRAALGVVRVHESALYQSRDAVIAQLQTAINVPEDQLIDTIKSISR